MNRDTRRLDSSEELIRVRELKKALDEVQEDTTETETR